MFRSVGMRQGLLLRATVFSNSGTAQTCVRGITTDSGKYNMLAADRTMELQKIFHATSFSALVFTPIALMTHPCQLSLPLDLALSVIFPLHAHFGISWILTDYVKSAKPFGPIRVALLGLTGLTTLGLLKLSITGEGVVGTVKATWRDSEHEKKEG